MFKLHWYFEQNAPFWCPISTLKYKDNFFPFTAYTMAKYGMSFCVLGMSEEFKDDGVAVNALWPRTGGYWYPAIMDIVWGGGGGL